ncbi:MAG: hypothetical protein PHI59_03800 [Candidatus Omnitrophica bacterium]|nr:hypothetical protein [Candidatus Omnitrophota bacterium]
MEARKKNRFFFGYLLESGKGMMAVKPKMTSLIIFLAIMTAILTGNMAYAESKSQSVHLTVIVVGALSLNIDENALPALAGEANSGKPAAEAFSDIKEHNIIVSKLVRDNSDLWLFTKTE